jgi:hypothetical protein
MFSPLPGIDISGDPQNTRFFYRGAITNPAIPSRQSNRNGPHFPYCNIILVSKRGVKPLTDRLIKRNQVNNQ